ncbi:YkvA family protein [Thermodesulfatator autotrophicus]|uniref:DUF1232 domain-containing protein n=1 Tax=Thermodesulfatator autotrophicus TaxID=1795632 RepID=A0A177E8H3_9BACT|nr:DUF1232 domain-containing protein [Thermodesulfatator autotrophicus]OAG28254.1 hypothetical protein TH606_02565 [Thermodesulfatator autotrophicus]
MNLVKAKKEAQKYIKLMPKFLKLLYKLLKDPRVPAKDKTILAAAIVYLMNPLDFIPDMIPFFGMVDDLYLVGLALLRLLYHTNEQVLRDNWEGEEDIVSLVKKIVEIGVKLLPPRVRESVLGSFE